MDGLRCALIGLGSALLVSFTLGATALAAEDELYAARVPLASQDQSERQAGFRRAFEQVLIKVSGQRTLPKQRVISDALAQPERYVASYRYTSAPRPTAPDGDTPSPTLWLWTQFDAAAIKALLRDANVAVWGQARPSVLLWFALEQPSGPVVLGADGGDSLTAVVEEVAAQRGLPLILPLLDLEDRARLSEGKLWAGFEEDILAASSRYQSEAVLVGRAYHLLSGQWETRWRLLLAGAARDWTGRGASLQPLVEEGIQQTADYLAQPYLAGSGALVADGMELVVGGIDSMRDYAQVLSYLKDLEVVKTVRVKGLQGDRVWFLVSARGGVAALREALALNRKLIPIAAPGVLEFELQP